MPNRSGRPSEIIGRMGKSGGVVAYSQSNLSRVTFGKTLKSDSGKVTKSTRREPEAKAKN